MQEENITIIFVAIAVIWVGIILIIYTAYRLQEVSVHKKEVNRMQGKDEQIFAVLNSKGRELSEWLTSNFDPHTKIVITTTGVTIEQELYGQPIVQFK